MSKPDYDWWIANAHKDSSLDAWVSHRGEFEHAIHDRYHEVHERSATQGELNQALYRVLYEPDRYASMQALLDGIQKEPDPPLPSALIRRPIVGDFLGPLPDGEQPGIYSTGYFSPSLMSVADSSARSDVLYRHQVLGARHFMVWAQWSNDPNERRGEFAPNGWSGPRDFDAFADAASFDEFGDVLLEIIAFGMTPIVVVSDRAYHEGKGTILRHTQQLAEAFGDKIGWMIPEFESDEIRGPSERAAFIGSMRNRFPYVGIHFGSNMPTERGGYAGLPGDCLIFAQAPRSFSALGSLKNYGRAVTNATRGYTVINAEHSAPQRLSGHTTADQTRRAVILAAAGWQDSLNALSMEARIRCQLEYRPPSIESLTDAWPYLEIAVPGIERVSKDTVYHPYRALDDGARSKRIDLILASMHPDPNRRRWHYNIGGWDGEVRPI